MAIRTSPVFNDDPSEALLRFFQEQENPTTARRDAALAKLSRMKPGHIWALAHAPSFEDTYDTDHNARSVLTGVARAVAMRVHVQHPWAGGWKCWMCPMWSPKPLTGTCRVPTEVSLSFVPGSYRRRTRWVRKWRGE